MPLFDGAGRIWFNGDTVETCSDVLREESLGMLGDLRDRLVQDGRDPVLLPGNHDPDREGPSWMTLEDGEILVTHGDMCFRYGSPWSPWVQRIKERLHTVEVTRGGWENARTLEQRAALARDYAFAFQPRPRRYTGLAGKLETLLHAAWPPSTPLTILKIWTQGPEMVARWMEEFAPAAKVLIMGHTHRAGCWFRRGKWIINTGAFHPMTAPHVVEHSPGKLELRRFVMKAGEWRMGKSRGCLRREESGWVRE